MPDSSVRIPVEAVRPFVRSSGPQPSPRAQRLHGPVFIAYLVCLGLALALVLIRSGAPETWGWVEGVLYLLGAATMLVAIGRRLPAQNVVACGFVIGGVSGVMAAFGAKVQLPFGRLEYSEFFGPRALGVLAWPVPLLWITLILSSRGVAKLVLRPWRRMRQYGWWLMGVTATLVLAADLMLEPFAAEVRHYWNWSEPAQAALWSGAPLSNFITWWIVAAVIVAFATPWLIVKRSLPQPPDYHPLLVWLGLAMLFTAGAAGKQLWPATVVGAVICGAVAILAWRGGRVPSSSSSAQQHSQAAAPGQSGPPNQPTPSAGQPSPKPTAPPVS